MNNIDDKIYLMFRIKMIVAERFFVSFDAITEPEFIDEPLNTYRKIAIWFSKEYTGLPNKRISKYFGSSSGQYQTVSNAINKVNKLMNKHHWFRTIMMEIKERIEKEVLGNENID